MKSTQPSFQYFSKIFVKNLIWGLTRSKNRSNQALCNIARHYVGAFNDFSYDFKKNGELELLRKLGLLGFRRIFDVGANVGDWTKTAIDIFPTAEFHCFELSPNTFEKLRENLRSNKCHLNNFGLGSFNGEIQYKDYGDCSGVNTIITSTTFHDETVQGNLVTSEIRTGRSYCEDKNIDQIDLLKIDVEGAENLVLEGFTDLLRNNSIRCIQFEYGFANGDAHFLMKDFFELFERYGYQVGKIWAKGVKFSSFDYHLNQFDSGPNFFAVLKNESELIESVRGIY